MQERKVLLIDDDEDFVATLAERLRLRGFRVGTAPEGDQAFPLIDDMSPHVIVYDILLGVDALRRLMAAYPKIPVIILTDIGKKLLGDEGLRLGARFCLMKPFAIEELIDAMNASSQ